MNTESFTSGREYRSVNFDPGSLIGRQFENCRFVSCTFRETDLRSTVFDNCRFQRCDVILAKIPGLTLRSVTFEDSRLVGVPFGECNQFGLNIDFQECIIDSCTFLSLKLTKKSFVKNTFRNSDFMDCDLRDASFPGCNFDNVQFHHCNLQDSDFREAENYCINPEGNKIKGSKHRIPGVLSFLPFLGIELDL